MQVTVIQPGARLHYAVPAILARAGLLRRLYTDIHGDHGAIRLLAAALPDPMLPKPIRRLIGRRLPAGLAKSLVKDYPARALCKEIRKRLGLSQAGPEDAIETAIFADLAKVDFGPGDVIYTVLINSDIEPMRAARQKGAKIVHECMMSPDINLWLHEERSLNPGIEPQQDMAAIEAGRDRDKAKYALADLVLVPSEFIKQAVVALIDDPGKIHLVPYGIDEAWLEPEPRPKAGRVLCVGAVSLLKGTHHLAAACRELRRRGVKFECRVVGPANKKLLGNPLFDGPTYVGQVPRSDIAAEYLAADLFVLPTLAEGSALVNYEALASGLPVVTTPNSGSVVRDGEDGYIVPVRDPIALADKIEAIVTDRDLRNRLSANARQRAADFTLARYQERLLDALDRRFGHGGS